MAQEFSRLLLGGSTDGKGIKIAAISTPGTLLHTSVSPNLDEVYLEVFNSDTVERTITVEWGGAVSPDNQLVFKILPGDLAPIALGRHIQNGLDVRAFADTANVLVVYGYVNRIATLT